MSNVDPGMDVSPPPGYKNPDPNMAVSPPPGYKNPDPGINVSPTPPQQQKIAAYIPGGPPQPDPEPRKPAPTAPAAPAKAEPTNTAPASSNVPQRYTPSAPSHYSRWGRNRWNRTAAATNPAIYNSSFMPSEGEAIRVAGGADRQLAMYAAPSVAGPAQIVSGIASMIGPFFDFFSNNAFSSNYRATQLGGIQRQEAQVRMQEAGMRMQMEQMQMARERMLDQMEIGITNHKDMLLHYGDVYQQLEEGSITEDEARQQIKLLNHQYNHDYLNTMLDNKGLGAVEKYLGWEDAKLQDKWNAYTTMTSPKGKAGKDTEVSGDNWLADGGGDATRFHLGAKPYDDGTAAAGSAPLTSTPGGAEPATPSDFDKKLAKDFGLSPEGVKEAHKAYVNGKLDAQADKAHNKSALRQMESAATAIGSAIDAAATGDGTTEEKLAKMKVISPDTASDVDGLMNYHIAPTSLGSERRHLIQLAQSASNGKYKEDFYAINQKMSDPNSVTGKELNRISQMGSTALSVLSALKELPENEAIPFRKMEALKGSAWTGDPKYTNLYHAMVEFSNEVGAVSSGTGTSRMGIFTAMMKHFKETASPAQIRGAMIAEMQPGVAFRNEINSTWQNATGSSDPAPMMNSPGGRLFENIMLIDTKTGRVPEGSPPELMAVGKKGSGDPIPGVEARRAAREWIEKNRDNPDAQEQIQKLLKIIGIH